MIHPSNLGPASAGTRPFAAANTSKPVPQSACGDIKMTNPCHRSRRISLFTLIGIVSCNRQDTGQPSLEPLSP